jgi:hypothetical protein
MAHLLPLRLSLLPLLLLPLALSGCRSEPKQAPLETAAGIEIAPQPYTAEEMRAAHPVGTFTVYRVAAAGQATLTRRTTWELCDENGCALVNNEWIEGSPEASRETRARFGWDELRDHASFPAGVTEIREESIQVGAGRFDCWLYRFVEPSEQADQPAAENSFWFAKHSAGSPVRYQVRVGGELIFDMELLETNRVRS